MTKNAPKRPTPPHRTQARLYALFEAHSGRSTAEIEAALDRDRFMSAEEAVGFGLLDKVVQPSRKAPAALAAAAAAMYGPTGAQPSTGGGGGGGTGGAGGAKPAE